MGKTTLSVSEELADELDRRSGRDETPEDVIWRLLERAGADESGAGTVESGVGDPGTEAGDAGSGADARRTDPDGVGEADGADEVPTGAAEASGADQPPDTFEEYVDGVALEVLPGSGDALEGRREALHAVVEHLREHGSATPKDFKQEVYPDHPAGYADAGGARSWWDDAMYKGLSALASRAGEVESADDGAEWRWDEDEERGE